MSGPFAGAVSVLLGLLAGTVVNIAADRLPGAPGEAACAGRRRARRAALLALCALGFAALRAGTRGWVQASWLGLWGAFFLFVAVVDLEHRLVLNKGLAVAAALAVTGSLLRLPLAPHLASCLVGGAIGLGGFLVLALAGRGALGAGDVKLAAVIGLATGYPLVLRALAAGIFLGGVAALCALLAGLGRKAAIPYAPWLALGAYAVMLQAALTLPA
jgi:leader peptidase (prepilin peptidase)/N-methyltransferase